MRRKSASYSCNRYDACIVALDDSRSSISLSTSESVSQGGRLRFIDLEGSLLPGWRSDKWFDNAPADLNVCAQKGHLPRAQMNCIVCNC